MGHCCCRPGWTCPWCRAAIERAEGAREHGDTRPVDDFDLDAQVAAVFAGGGW